MLTPIKAVAKWERELAKLKKATEKDAEKEGWTGRQKSIIYSKRSTKLARTVAKEAGMKSMGEVKCAADMSKRKIRYKYEEVTFEYQQKVQHYTPDFVIKRKGSTPLYIEYKGKMDYATRTKMLAVKRCNPDINIAMVFENAKNGITKRKRKKDGTYSVPTKYWQWAEKNGFLWSEHTVKKEWL
jgi:hypothetical protein